MNNSSKANIIDTLRADNADLRERLGKTNRELAQCKAQIAWFQRQLFGQRSEKLSTITDLQQGWLFSSNDDAPPSDKQPETDTIKTTRRRKFRDNAVTDSGLRFDPDVPVKVIRAALPEGVTEDDVIDWRRTHRLAQSKSDDIVIEHQHPVIKHINQPGARVDTLKLAAGEQALDDADASGALFIACEQPVPLLHCHRSIGSLDVVCVERDVGVVEADHQLLAALAGVADRPHQRMAGLQIGPLHDAVADCPECLGSREAACTTCREFLLAFGAFLADQCLLPVHLANMQEALLRGLFGFDRIDKLAPRVQPADNMDKVRPHAHQTAVPGDLNGLGFLDPRMLMLDDNVARCLLRQAVRPPPTDGVVFGDLLGQRGANHHDGDGRTLRVRPATTAEPA